MKRRSHWPKWLLLAVLCAAFLYEAGLFGMVVWFKYRNPANTAIMQETLDALRRSHPKASLSYRWVPYAQISPSLAWRLGDGKLRTPGSARVKLTRGELIRLERSDRSGSGALPARDVMWSVVVMPGQ